MVPVVDDLVDLLFHEVVVAVFGHLYKIKSYKDEEESGCEPNERIDLKDIVTLGFAICPELKESLDAEQQDESHYHVHVLENLLRAQAFLDWLMGLDDSFSP